jgi:hypothetical protein
MPITRFLDGHFDAETRRVMGVAFESARAALRVSDTVDPVLPLVANKIIDLAKSVTLICSASAP